jgi:hypothetical protein
MATAEMAALRAAYADAEEWMLEGVCASLDGLRGDRASVRETLGSFLGELDGETMETLADAWAPRARDDATEGARAIANESIRATTRDDARAGDGTMAETTTAAAAASRDIANARTGKSSRDRAPARETKALRFVEKTSNARRAVARGARAIRPGDELAPGDLAKSCVNCLACGKIFDLRAKDGVVSQTALEFLESSARCTFCGEYVEVTLADGVTRFRGGDAGDAEAKPTAEAATRDVFDELSKISLGTATSIEGSSADAATVAAIAAKDRLVHFDQTSAKRTTVIDDQSEWYEIDGNAWLDETERAELKRQAKEMAEAEEEAKRKARTTWTLDLVGRKVAAAPVVEGDASKMTNDDRASDSALAAAKAIRAALATNEEHAQGGGGAAASAAETARELERRVFVDPRVSARPSFLAAASPTPASANDEGASKKPSKHDDAFARRAGESSRVLDDDPFESVWEELRDLGFSRVS